mmetsp:Transcript_1700/g.2621  ORF Transcript_1700/g.2621 Transcript_1700/m.2621 type:complete len:112 (-) Transcript_1700:1123-1458(-)
MATNPIFPASRAELKALYPVLEIACVDSKAGYDEVKSKREHPKISDIAGAAYRSAVAETYVAVRSGECKKLFDDLIYCNERYPSDYAKRCKSVRDSLQMCAVENKLGELGK